MAISVKSKITASDITNALSKKLNNSGGAISGNIYFTNDSTTIYRSNNSSQITIRGRRKFF